MHAPFFQEPPSQQPKLWLGAAAPTDKAQLAGGPEERLFRGERGVGASFWQRAPNFSLAKRARPFF